MVTVRVSVYESSSLHGQEDPVVILNIQINLERYVFLAIEALKVDACLVKPTILFRSLPSAYSTVIHK